VDYSSPTEEELALFINGKREIKTYLADITGLSLMGEVRE
jgi:hypothetical protein